MEDSARRAVDSGTPFVVTPAMEKHLRALSPGGQSLVDDAVKKWKREAEQAVRRGRTPLSKVGGDSMHMFNI